MGRSAKIRLETVFDFVMMLLGLLITVVSWQYGFGTFRRPGPGLYPFFVGLCMMFFSLILFLSELRQKKSQMVFEKGGLATFLLIVVTCGLWIVLMPFLGYVIGTLLATLAFSKIMRLEGWWKPLAVSIGTAFFIYVLFDVWLYIDLPRGILA